MKLHPKKVFAKPRTKAERYAQLLAGHLKTNAPQVQARLARLRSCFAMLSELHDRQYIVECLAATHKVCEKQIYKDIALSIEVFASIEKTSPQGIRTIYAAAFRRLAKKAEDSVDLHTAVLATKEAARLEGAYDYDEQLASGNPDIPQLHFDYRTKTDLVTSLGVEVDFVMVGKEEKSE